MTKKELIFDDINAACGPCVAAGALITTTFGLVPVESVKAGDKVLAHDGSWRKVIGAVSGVAETVLIKGYAHYGFEIAAGHPVLSAKYIDGAHLPTWERAADMQRQLWASPLKCAPLQPPPTEYTFKNGEKPANADYSWPASAEYSFWWLVGNWLSNGWLQTIKRGNREIGKKAFYFTTYAQSAELAEKTAIFGQKWDIKHEPGPSELCVSSQLFANWLQMHFRGPDGSKKFPTWLFSLDNKQKQAVINGFFNYRPEDSDTARVTATASKQLAIGMKAITAQVGVSLTVSNHASLPLQAPLPGITGEIKELFVLKLRSTRTPPAIDVGTWAWSRVRSVTTSGMAKRVYGLEIEDCNSFVADNMVIHGMSLQGAGAAAMINVKEGDVA